MFISRSDGLARVIEKCDKAIWHAVTARKKGLFTVATSQEADQEFVDAERGLIDYEK
jgi:hypothetical protein